MVMQNRSRKNGGSLVWRVGVVEGLAGITELIQESVGWSDSNEFSLGKPCAP